MFSGDTLAGWEGKFKLTIHRCQAIKGPPFVIPAMLLSGNPVFIAEKTISPIASFGEDNMGS
jgi:hypothetical protein